MITDPFVADGTGAAAAGGSAADCGHPAGAALELRRRLRALVMGQPEAFDMVFYHLGDRHPSAAVALGAGGRLRTCIVLLADLAWVLGERHAHETLPLPAPPEVLEVRRVYKAHGDTRRHFPMTAEQAAAVVAYIDALIPVMARCVDLDEHAPSRTIARTSAGLRRDMVSLREAVA